MTVLRLVPTEAFTHCWPWHLRDLQPGPSRGGVCCFCSRAVAVPDAARGKTVACIYCGLDRGDVEAIDKPLDMEAGDGTP